MNPMPDSSQSDDFIETARALGANEDEATFKAKPATIAQQNPKDDASPPPAQRKKK
jgi:hypothetical protein